MRKLSEIPAEEGVAVIGKLLPVIEQMIQKTGDRNELTPMAYFGKLLEKSPAEAITMIAIIDGVDREKIAEKSVFDILKAIAALSKDDELLALFNLQI